MPINEKERERKKEIFTPLWRSRVFCKGCSKYAVRELVTNLENN